ncbi:MAG: hypothetical protein BWY50_00264 [Spirochaetes bacterium ADurb.Bin315]|nr:MAG: hypothetical protein BWY50_00264 [Spirochaetes bacterium ADurb.Bin315]
MIGGGSKAFASHAENVDVRPQEDEEVPPEQAHLPDRIRPVPIEHIPPFPQIDIRLRKERAEQIVDHYRSAARAAAAMGGGERFMKVEVEHVEAHVAGTDLAHDRIEVRPVIVQQGSRFMDRFADCKDILFKKPEGVGVGQHEGGDLIGELALQISQIHQSFPV